MLLWADSTRIMHDAARFCTPRAQALHCRSDFRSWPFHRRRHSAGMEAIGDKLRSTPMECHGQLAYWSQQRQTTQPTVQDARLRMLRSS